MSEHEQARQRRAYSPATVDLDEGMAAARARALSSPLRWRILRLCLHEALTNKELSDTLDVNPGSMLHHVRTLVSTGYLAPQESRRGTRNAVEIPYLATDLTWQAAQGETEVATAMRELLEPGAEVAEQADTPVWAEAMHLDEALRAELAGRLADLLGEFRARGDALEPGRARRWLVTASLHAEGEERGA